MITLKRFFDLNNPVWRLMGFLSDMLLLTVIWALFCIPVLTIGPSTMALFKVCAIQLRGEDQGVIKNFLNCFMEQFNSSLILGLMTTITIGMLITSSYYYNSLTSKISTFLLFVCLFSLLVIISLLLYVLPLKAVLKNSSLINICKLALVLSIVKIHWTILITVTFISSVFLITYVAPYLSIFAVGLFALTITKVVTQLYKESSLDIKVLE